MLLDLIRKNRSYRRFYQQEPVPTEALHAMVEAARLSGSGRNLQPLKFSLCNEPQKNAQIFETLAWAGYFKDWLGPEEGERPSAYITLLLDTQISAHAGIDPGIMAQSMLLQATELGFGGCMIGSFQPQVLAQILELPERYSIQLVLALGKPKETVVIDRLPENGSIQYWRDAQQVHHVPKRDLEDCIL